MNESKYSLLDIIVFSCISLAIAIILMVMTSTVASAQVTLYGCTDSLALNYNSSATINQDGSCVYTDVTYNSAFGFNTTAIVQTRTPSLSTFNPDKLIVRYKKIGTSGWTTIKLNIEEHKYTHSGRIDTLGISFWYFESLINVNGTYYSDGDRYRVYVRLNNLDTDADYKVRVKFKGSSFFGLGNQTNKLTTTFSTHSFFSFDAPYTTHPQTNVNFNPNQAAPPTSQARVANPTLEVIASYNMLGQRVDQNTKGIVVNVYSDGTKNKVNNK